MFPQNMHMFPSKAKKKRSLGQLGPLIFRYVQVHHMLTGKYGNTVDKKSRRYQQQFFLTPS